MYLLKQSLLCKCYSCQTLLSAARIFPFDTPAIYLPREFTIVFALAFYIAPSGNAKVEAKEALWSLHDTISDLQTAHPDSFVVKLGTYTDQSKDCVSQIPAICGF